MAIVTGIYTSKKLVRIAADGRNICALSADAFRKFPLVVGDAIDVDDYLGRVASHQARAAYEAALTLLARSARTGTELQRALAQKGYVAPAIDAAIARLRQARLLDDRALAERMVELAARQPVSRHAMARKLRGKGMNEDDIEQALSGLDDAQQRDAVRLAARKLAPRYEGQDARAARRKLAQALMRRGFTWSTIEPALNEIYDDDEQW